MSRSSLTPRGGKAILVRSRGVKVCGVLREMHKVGGQRPCQKLGMGKALNAKLKSLHFRLMWSIESPWEGQPMGGACILNYP